MKVGVGVSVLPSLLPADMQGSEMPVHSSHPRLRYWSWAVGPYALRLFWTLF